MGSTVEGILLLRLYRIFRIKEEHHAVTTKLAYIYEWIEPQAGIVTLDVITDLRRRYTRESNHRTIDALYHDIKLINMNRSNRYDTSTRRAPIVHGHEQGWKVS